ncbi:translocation/assembly module TamB domain-containing protein [Pedobacter sp. MW01-1-1]|uniref:translocation/assembly module TamB domain-containing protein n=1 Tax=Pedobacter sp. MW01-1-1 TaxID=3383027 RepID=UPI003FEF102E
MLIFVLQFKPVQTYFAQKAAAYLSKELKTTVSIKSLYIKPFKSIVLEDLLVLDLQKDTLLNTPQLMVDINRLSINQRVIDINTIQINNGNFFLKDFKGKASNLDFIIDYFDSGKPEVKKPKKKPYDITLDRVILNKLAFKYKNYAAKDTLQGSSVNFENVSATDISGILEDLDTKSHLLKARIKNLTLRERSGFYLKNLSADAIIDSNAIELKQLLVLTNQSRLTDYYKMQFKTYRDFNHYVANVRMKANFKNSHISSRDVAYFAPELTDMRLNIDVDGQISGLVNNLRAKKLSIKTGKATYIKGDFNIKGLPKWRETFMDLKIEMAGTNRTDLAEVLAGITNSKKKLLPTITEKFGNVNFNGNFTGLLNDFIAYGEFKTKLGRVVSDVNMKIGKDQVPTYSGTVKSYDFHIGQLVDEPLLGRVTSKLYVKGRGTELNELKENIKGDISYIDVNKYRYSNVKINGKLDKKFFDGELVVNDKNVQLDFNGSVNLNPKLPIFNFTAEITKAKLKKLNLFKDSLIVSAKFKTNFSGYNLDNIAGKLAIQEIQFKNPNGNFFVDSIQVSAQGTGSSRFLSIESDILEASIRGEYDLNSIVSYYKSMAKNYIPSLQTKIIQHKVQLFEFNLKVKKFDPMAQIIAPGLQIEEGANFTGLFDSQNQKASLNGFIKNISYNGIKANNVIIDQNMTKEMLHLIVTTDRAQLNDSLYLDDINISNILRNDSLAFNVKMSNSEAVNQLDLNGLVEFTKNQDTTARLSILPSLLKVNNEEWRIQEKVRIIFNNGKIEIRHFDLTNGPQQLIVDGFISEDPKDLIKISLNQFNLKTLTPFTKGMGISLGGYANGETSVYGILKAPRINDNIEIDSLSINKIYIGTLIDTSSYNQISKKIGVYTQIMNRDTETFKLTGELDLKEKKLDVNVKMDESELTILEPFVDELVSNLKGKVSADLKLQGNLAKPDINGTLSFNKGQVMVNYLKTTYVITDDVQVEKSIVKLDDFKLSDLEDHEGIANGTIDLSNINYPNLNVVLKAQSLMALNTTSKDNSLYFGTAYGTGTFSFIGPTNKMRIDIKAKTEKGTVFNLPLNSAETVSDKDFINFIGPDTTTTTNLKSSYFDGLTLSFKLSIDPNTVANIYTVLGNLSGRGNADLTLNINSYGDFDMSGDYIIESGSFDFTAQEVINKKFDIRQGGTIRWTGNPSAAQINLKAIYALRANLSELYKAANREVTSDANQRVNTEVEMGLSGLLEHPDIRLDINFPNQPSIREQLQSYFGDYNNMQLQAFSLIIRRSFAPGTGGESLGTQLSSTVSSTATELIFNQFNNVLSSLNLNFVDFNVKSLSEANASFKLFDNRLLINAGFSGRNTLNDLAVADFTKSNIGGEIEAIYLIRKDGTLTAKVANKPPSQQSIFLNSGISTTANVTSFGLMYTQQFDTFKEFLRKISGAYRRDLKRKQASEPTKNTNKNMSKELINPGGKTEPKK